MDYQTYTLIIMFLNSLFLGINEELGPTVQDSFTMRNCLYESNVCAGVINPIPAIPPGAIVSSVGGGCFTCDNYNMCNSASKFSMGMLSIFLVTFFIIVH